MEKIKFYRGHWSNILKNIFSKVYLMIILLCILLKKNSSLNIMWCMALAIFIIIVYSIIVWKSKYFYIDKDMFVYVQGIIGNTKKQIPISKITVVDIKSNLISRVLGSVTLKLNTGNATLNEDEFMMNVKKDYALLIQSKILGQDVKSENNNIKKLRITYKNIFIYTLTQNKFAWMAGLFVIVNKFYNNIRDDIVRYFKTIEDLILNYRTTNLVLKLIIVLISIYILSIIVSFVLNSFKYGNFIISRDDNSLNIKYGLINLVEYSISLDKIQGIKLKQNLLQQFLNIYRFEAIVIGSDEANSLLFPVVCGSDKELFINNILPEYSINKSIKKAPKRAIKRFIIKRSFIYIIIASILIKLINQYVNTSNLINTIMYTLFIVLLIFQIILGYVSYLNNGLMSSDTLVLLTNGSRIKKTYVIKKSRIQSLQIQQSILQKKIDIFNYKIDVATGSFGETINIKNMDIKMSDNILLEI